MKDLYQYDSQLIRVEAEGGLKLEGFVSAYPAEYGLHEFGREEESIRIDDYQLFEGDIIRIEKLGLRLVIKEFPELTVQELYDILKLRVNVFVVEQQCPYAELDDRDQKAIHIWVDDGTGIQAYLRLMKPGVEADCFAIGRVVTAKRGCGLGRLILTEGIAYAEDEYDASRIYLEAQTYARGFYEKLGFRQVSEEFTVDGIPHIGMIRESVKE